MRGQNTIIRMRLAGYKPSFVWVFVLQNECEKSAFRDAENVIPSGGRAEIQIGIDDFIGTLDLRALSGLTVLLQGVDRDRLRQAFARLKTFNPLRVVVSGSGFFPRHGDGMSDIVPLITPDTFDFRAYMVETEPQVKVLPADAWRESLLQSVRSGNVVTGARLPWSKTHDYLRFRGGEVTLWQGINGHGKSQLLGQHA